MIPLTPENAWPGVRVRCPEWDVLTVVDYSDGLVALDGTYGRYFPSRFVLAEPEPEQSLSAVPTDRAMTDPAPPVAVPNMVNHPPHYTAHPSGVECIQITEHMGFCLGNALKYIWRADLKADAIEDLKKARWYLDREIARRQLAEDFKPKGGV